MSKAKEFIERQSGSWAFWDGYDKRLVGKLDAISACDIERKETLDTVIEIVKKQDIYGHKEINSVTQAIINELEKLKI